MAIPIVALVSLPLWSPRLAVGPQGALMKPGAMGNLAIVLHWPSFLAYLLFLVAVIGVMYFWLFVRPYTAHGLVQRVQAIENRVENMEEAVTEPQPATPPPLPRYWRGE